MGGVSDSTKVIHATVVFADDGSVRVDSRPFRPGQAVAITIRSVSAIPSAPAACR